MILADPDDTCPICRENLSNCCKTCKKENKCFIKDITINNSTNIFKAYTTCPIDKGTCEHIYHSHCINKWRRKRDICPLDNMFWDSTILDSFVTGEVLDK